MKGFEELECWKEARALRKHLKTLIDSLPKSEEYQLKSQLTRALRSVTNNIAEGYGRFHYKENAQFCRQARGSLYETIDHLIIAYEENYLSKDDLLIAREMALKTITILNGYINYLVKVAENKTINK